MFWKNISQQEAGQTRMQIGCSRQEASLQYIYYVEVSTVFKGFFLIFFLQNSLEKLQTLRLYYWNRRRTSVWYYTALTSHTQVKYLKIKIQEIQRNETQKDLTDSNRKVTKLHHHKSKITSTFCITFSKQLQSVWGQRKAQAAELALRVIFDSTEKSYINNMG